MATLKSTVAGGRHSFSLQTMNSTFPARLLFALPLTFTTCTNSTDFSLLSSALRRLPRLKEFHVVVTKWHHGEFVKRLDRRPIQNFLREVLCALRHLEVLTLPPLSVFTPFYILLNPDDSHKGLPITCVMLFSICERSAKLVCGRSCTPHLRCCHRGLLMK